jgi:hypothetical protein
MQHKLFQNWVPHCPLFCLFCNLEPFLKSKSREVNSLYILNNEIANNMGNMKDGTGCLFFVYLCVQSAYILYIRSDINFVVAVY